jgi:phage minor structural protein
MLTLFHNNQQIVLDTTEYYVRELASGLDEVIFEISIWDPNYAMINEEENIVDRGGQRYLIKQIDAGAVTAKIVCQLDLDEWKASMLVGYNSGTKTVAQQISAVLPSGWSVVDYSYSSIGRTIKGDLTPLQVCEQCRSTYQVYVRWDNKDKRVYIYPQALGTPVGSFATRELNLKEINYKGKSNNFATRLYAYGKDGLSFAGINDGKPYVDNNTYSDRVICAYWQDDRYTDKTSLLNDAIEHLAKLAVPERSYDCAIVDLQATNPELYNNLDFSLFTTATLIDDVKNVAVDYLVIERHVWPYHPDRNDVIFNSAPVKIQNAVIQIEDELTNPNSTFQQILQAEIDLVTDWLTDNESHCYITQNEDGTIKDFIFVNGDQPIETATQVMRINASGLGFSKNGINGPFTNAFVFDSVKGGHLIADFITSGTMLADRIQGGTLESIDSTTISGVTYKNFRLNMTTGAIEALKLSIKSTNFTLTESGLVTMTGATINGGKITYTNGKFSVDTNGNMSAKNASLTSATVTGSITSVSGSNTAGINNGEVYSQYNGQKISLNNAGEAIYNETAGRNVLSLFADNNIGELTFTNSQGILTLYAGSSHYINSDNDFGISTSDLFNVSADRINFSANEFQHNGSVLPSGGFYDRDGNYITVTDGLITGGV